MTIMNSETKQISSRKVILICCDISELGIIFKEPLIKSGSNRLQVKISWFKAWNARNSRVIAKFCNAEARYFNRKISIHEL